MFGLGARDRSQRWHFQCDESHPRTLTIRFARVPAGEDPASGHLTLGEKKPLVVVGCGEKPIRLDPNTGKKV